LIIVTWVSDQPLRNVVFGVTLRLLVTHFIVVSCHDAINKLGRSPVTSVIYSAWFVAAKFTASAAGTLNSICSEARYWLRIAISAYPTYILLGGGGSHRNIAMPFGIEKLEWCGYPLVKKF